MIKCKICEKRTVEAQEDNERFVCLTCSSEYRLPQWVKILKRLLVLVYLFMGIGFFIFLLRDGEIRLFEEQSFYKGVELYIFIGIGGLGMIGAALAYNMSLDLVKRGRNE